jgi:hypothetical protein
VLFTKYYKYEGFEIRRNEVGGTYRMIDGAYGSFTGEPKENSPFGKYRYIGG